MMTIWKVKETTRISINFMTHLESTINEFVKETEKRYKTCSENSVHVLFVDCSVELTGEKRLRSVEKWRNSEAT